MGCIVVLLKCQSWTVLLHERQQFRCQHLITVVCGTEIALDDNQLGTTMETKWTPNHYAASTKSVNLLNTTLRIAFSRSTPHPYPAISKPNCETWLVAKDNVIPASLIPSNVSSGPFQMLTKVKWRETGSCVWSPNLQSAVDSWWWMVTPEPWTSVCLWTRPSRSDYGDDVIWFVYPLGVTSQADVLASDDLPLHLSVAHGFWNYELSVGCILVCEQLPKRIVLLPAYTQHTHVLHL